MDARPESSPGTPVLLTQPADQDNVAFMAVVDGVLSLNDRGCFEIGHHLVLAPVGSVVSADPLGIVVPGSGLIPVGVALSGSGGWFPSETLSEETQNLATTSTRGIVILNGLPERISVASDQLPR